MNLELSKRIVTSLVLITLLSLAFFYAYILIISLIIVSLITWVEFSALISKIYKKDNLKTSSLKLIIKAISLIYIFIFSALIFVGITQIDPFFKTNMLYLFSVCICSDIGGFFFGKIFKGKKLTKISPNKTISGAIGSFIFSLFLLPFFNNYFINHEILSLLIITLSISLISQIGDIFISFIKRKARVKDTSDILPGHGGVLDRIDGIIFAIPMGFLLFKYL